MKNIEKIQVTYTNTINSFSQFFILILQTSISTISKNAISPFLQGDLPSI